jgi:hypothetical protein
MLKRLEKDVTAAGTERAEDTAEGCSSLFLVD